MDPAVWDLLKLVLSGAVGALLTFIVMVIRERNNFSVKVMDIFLQDKENWVQERAQLEKRIDYLTTELDKVKNELYKKETP